MSEELSYKLSAFKTSRNLDERYKLAIEIVKMTNNPKIIKKMGDYVKLYRGYKLN